MLVLDPNGTVLCDSSVKTPTAARIRTRSNTSKASSRCGDRIKAGGYSVDNPFVNAEAFQKILADLFAQKASTPPRPVFFNFNGMDPQDHEALAGRKFRCLSKWGTDGLARNLKVIEGGDPQADGGADAGFDALAVPARLQERHPGGEDRGDPRHDRQSQARRRARGGTRCK
jgi:hypothetical protein